MKQITNITILVMVLSIPFAVSQTRKVIPAGRYESLSGIKISHSAKGIESSAAKDTLGLFWSEVTKHVPQSRKENIFYASGSIDNNLKNFLQSKGITQSLKLDNKVNILISDNLNRDLDLIKKIQTKGELVILKDKPVLKEVMNALGQYEVLVYQSEAASNYFLLKLK